MIVIALSGLARAGKDTVADILVRDHGFTKMAFAAPLKAMVRDLDPIVGTYQPDCDCDCGCCDETEPMHLSDLYDYGLTDEEIKDSYYGDEVRRIWERFGTEVMRKRHPNFWVDQARDALFASGKDRIVFSDCRFPNEADMVYELSLPDWDEDSQRYVDNEINSSVWHITRPGLGIDLGEDAHEAESHAGQLGEEITIHNDGSLEGLTDNVDVALGFVTSGEVKDMAGLAWAKAFNTKGVQW
jgi:hypothetical protein